MHLMHYTRQEHAHNGI